jgi:hypothetical protein
MCWPRRRTAAAAASAAALVLRDRIPSTPRGGEATPLEFGGSQRFRHDGSRVRATIGIAGL